MVLGWVSESVEGWIERKYSGGIEIPELGCLGLGLRLVGDVVDVGDEEEVEVEVLEDEEM